MNAFTWESTALHHALEQLQLGEPGFFLLRLVQAGVAGGAARVNIRLEQARVRATFEPDPARLAKKQLQQFGERAQQLGQLSRRPDALDHLLVASLAALAEGLDNLTVVYRAPEGDTRLTLRPSSGELEYTPPSQASYRLDFELRRTPGPFLQDLLQGLRRRAAITRLLGERCTAAPIPIILDGRPLNLQGRPGARAPRLNERDRSAGFRSVGLRVLLAPREGPGLLALPLPDAAAAAVIKAGPHYLETATIPTPLEGNRTLFYQLTWPQDGAPWPVGQPPEMRVTDKTVATGNLSFVAGLGGRPENGVLLREFARIDGAGNTVRQACYLEDDLPGHPELISPGLAAYAQIDLGWQLEGLGQLYALADGVLLAPLTVNLGCPGAVALLGEAGLSYDCISLELVENEALDRAVDWLHEQTEELAAQVRAQARDADGQLRLRVSQGWARALLGRLPEEELEDEHAVDLQDEEAIPVGPDGVIHLEGSGADATGEKRGARRSRRGGRTGAPPPAAPEESSSPELAEHLEALLTQGKVESTGVFTLAVKQAHLKLGKFQHVNPAFYLLKAVQGAVASGSPEVRVKLGRRDVRVEFSPGLGPELLRGLPDRLIGMQMGQKDALDHLVMASSAAQALSPACLGWLYSSATEGFSVKVEADSFETRVAPPQPGPPKIVFYMRRKGGLLDQLTQLTSEHNSIGERFALCPIPVYLDGRLVNGERWPGKDQLVLFRFDKPPERLNPALRLLLAEPSPGTLVPPCLQQLSARHYDLGAKMETVRCLQEASPTALVQLRWHTTPKPLSLTSAPAVLGWRSMVYYVAEHHNFPVLKKGVMLRDYFEWGLIKRQQLLVLDGPPSPVPRGGPPCHAVLALTHGTSPARIWFVQNGMLLDGVQADVGCPGLLAWVGDVGLSTDLSQVRIVENERYQETLNWLREEAALMRREKAEAGF